jgi:hypothetical protein
MSRTSRPGGRALLESVTRRANSALRPAVRAALAALVDRKRVAGAGVDQTEVAQPEGEPIGVTIRSVTDVVKASWVRPVHDILNIFCMQSEDDAMPSDAAPFPAAPTRRSMLRGLGLLAAAPALPAVLAGCAPPTRAPAGAQVLRVGWTSDIDSQNPLTAATSEAVEVWQLVYDRLFQYDRALKPEPCLATGSTTSPDGLTITYALRPASPGTTGSRSPRTTWPGRSTRSTAATSAPSPRT